MCSHLSAFRVATNLRLAVSEHLAVLPLGFAETFGSGKLRKIIHESTFKFYVRGILGESYLAYFRRKRMEKAAATALHGFSDEDARKADGHECDSFVYGASKNRRSKKRNPTFR